MRQGYLGVLLINTTNKKGDLKPNLVNCNIFKNHSKKQKVSGILGLSAWEAEFLCPSSPFPHTHRPEFQLFFKYHLSPFPYEHLRFLLYLSAAMVIHFLTCPAPKTLICQLCTTNVCYPSTPEAEGRD